MKHVKIFGALLVLHLLVWTGSHFYFQQNKSAILVVVDTSYSMKQNFPAVKKWIEDFESIDRYKTIHIGTDKAFLGELAELKSKDIIFRTSFGKLDSDNLTRIYSQIKSDLRYLLSDGSLEPPEWQVISF
ncbi:hypothetical protein AB833_02855 [Chromatiales bacterium (ex Bugula neritina AB1)]|nr:hypothetical protein AB833_02855 [Chromatiales bacterium (ex Bugula neritina AB1)]